MVKMVLDADVRKGKISRHIYGHFSEHLGRCFYGGIWVGKVLRSRTRTVSANVIKALKAIKIPVLRWPGVLCG